MFVCGVSVVTSVGAGVKEWPALWCSSCLVDWSPSAMYDDFERTKHCMHA
jgi:hypothetical protein